MIIGVLPGLGGANDVAILLYSRSAWRSAGRHHLGAIILLSCIYWGALFGGAITSILFNIPGEPGRWPPPTAIRWRKGQAVR